MGRPAYTMVTQEINYMGGRGTYSIRKGFSNTDFKKGTKAAVAKAAEIKRPTGNFGGGADSGRQTEASMLAEFTNWKAGLSADQITAFADYTNGLYTSMNGALRGKDVQSYYSKESIAKKVKDLKSSFNHALSKDVTVYRGTGTKDLATLKEMTTVGGVFKDKGAFSTSLSRRFAKGWASGKGNPVVFTVRLPKGYKGSAYVQSISAHKNEKELLIRPGQNWKVVKQLSNLGSIPHYLITPI